MTPKPVLYILMRTDMDSLNPGKGMAQAAHAANAFVDSLGENPGDHTPGYHFWSTETDQGFGTTLVVSVENERELLNMVKSAQDADIPAGTILDPTYPVRDGRVTHALPINTCGYIFCSDYPVFVFKPVLKLPLHP
jgi:peptidyl-tRNA hydrolase